MRVLLLLFLVVVVNASDCEHCQEKFEDAIFNYNDIEALYIGNNRALSVQNPQTNAIYNPFLDIYLIQGVKNLQSVDIKYPFFEKEAGLFQKGKAPQTVELEKGCGFRSFASTDTVYESFSIFSGLCCHLLAMSTASHIIDAKFLNEFIQNKDAIYGDIGVRFDKNLKVIAINPYFETSLQLGDRVIGQKLCSFEEKILFAPIGKVMTLQIQRGDLQKSQKVTVQKRYGGASRSDSFLEQFGLFFNKELRIIEITPNSHAAKRGLKVGDKLLEVEGVAIQSAKELRDYLTTNSLESYNYLFDRDDFQFFIRF